MSMSDILAALLFLLVPLRHSKADRRMAKDTCALIQDDDDNNNNNIIILIIIKNIKNWENPRAPFAFKDSMIHT